MGTLREKSIDLIATLKEENVPDNRGMRILLYAQAARNDKQINLYEEYLLVAEALTFDRQSYMQAAWNRNVYIMHLLPLLNMKMMALLFQDQTAAKMWESWGMEAYSINREIRPHYILDNYQSFLYAEDNPQLLEELLKVRDSRHHLCRYEELLLRKKLFSQDEKIVSSEIEDILVEIYMIQHE